MKPLSQLLSRDCLIAIGLLTACAEAFSAETASPSSVSTNALEPGHSLHGEVFNEGPRQTAKLLPGTGKVKIKISTRHAEAQAFFNQGVGQLHGFWYFEAERSFRQVAALDPECAMAYWGMALANINNEKRAADFMKLAVAKKAQASRREQMWIGAYAAYFGNSKETEEARRS